MDLFGSDRSTPSSKADGGTKPLAIRMRPQTLDRIVGQEHLLGEGKPLRRAVETDRISSMILYGPPGCGKTTLAEVIAKTTRHRFESASGVLANVSILRRMLERSACRKKTSGVDTVLFIDEIHRFNKSQQDILLPYVENGGVILIGATTHNPFFFINTPLNSRLHIFPFHSLSEAAIVRVLEEAVKAPMGLNGLVSVSADVLLRLAAVCEGDVRRALNVLETAVLSIPPDEKGRVRLTRQKIEEVVQQKIVSYDRDEDAHYDTISAFIKSVRGSDPDAAVYWLAKMLYAGEDPRFIARRLIILASEDVGNADPRGITLAVSAMQAVEFIGMPEARITLSQAAIYLSCAPKSNSAYEAIRQAWKDVEDGRVLPVPTHLCSGPKPDKNEAEYRYPHDQDEGFVDQEYVPINRVYYRPTRRGYEETICKRIEYWNTIRKRKK